MKSKGTWIFNELKLLWLQVIGIQSKLGFEGKKKSLLFHKNKELGVRRKGRSLARWLERDSNIARTLSALLYFLSLHSPSLSTEDGLVPSSSEVRELFLITAIWIKHKKTFCRYSSIICPPLWPSERNTIIKIPLSLPDSPPPALPPKT